MFKEYQYGSFKGEIKNLLRKRLSLLDKIRRHKKRAEYHEAQVQLIENDTLKAIYLFNKFSKNRRYEHKIFQEIQDIINQKEVPKDGRIDAKDSA